MDSLQASIPVARPMPHDDNAEKAVLGSMLMNRDAIVTASESITGEDFYNRVYGVLFDAMVELENVGRPVDPVTLQNKLREKNLPPEVSGMEYIQELLDAVPISANIREYVRIVQEKATLRRLLHAAGEVTEDCYRTDMDLEEVLDNSEKRIFDIVQNRNVEELTPIRKIVENGIDRIEQASRTKGNVTGLATGFLDLDYKTAGFQKADLIIVAARPSMGKTAFALNIAQHMALKNNQTVMLFSLEMSKEQFVNRIFSLQSNVDAQKLRTGQLNTDEWVRLTESATEIGQSKLVIDDSVGITVPQMRSKCRKVKMTQGLDIVFVDYLQLIEGSGKYDSEQQKISQISRGLKALAREMQIPVVALSQLSRKVEERPNKRPQLSDLRESGAIEQDADVVMFIYREDYYKPDTDRKGIADIIIAKQRNGPVGDVELVWLAELTKFANLEKGTK